MSTLRTLLLAIREGHDSTQTERFITTRGGSLHLWGMYRQAMREMDGRVSALVHLLRQVEERVRTELIESREFNDTEAGSVAAHQFVCDVFRGACDRIEFAMLARKCRDTLREFGQFFHMALGLHEHFHPSGEPMSEDARRAHEVEFWAFRLRLVANNDWRTTHTFQGSLLELIPTLPQPHRSEFLAILRDPTIVLDWYEKLCEEGAPAIPEPTQRFEPHELVSMIVECAAYVPATQSVDRRSDPQVEAHASRDMLAHHPHQVHGADDLPDRSPSLARAR